MELAHLSGVSQSVISGVERGRLELREPVLERLAAALRSPAELVAAPTPETRVVATLRTTLPAFVTNRLKANLALAHFHVGRLLGDAPVDLPFLEGDRSPADHARHLRRSWNVAAGPISDLVALVEKLGVVCMVRDIAALHVGVVGSWPSRSRPIVFLGTHLASRDLRFALARELAYATVPGSLTTAGADQFAAEFLMPSRDVLWQRAGSVSWSRTGELEEQWGVPAAEILNHARRCGVITVTRHRQLAATVRELGTGSSRMRIEAPEALADAILREEAAGRTRAQVAESMLLGVDETRTMYLAGSRSTRRQP